MQCVWSNYVISKLRLSFVFYSRLSGPALMFNPSLKVFVLSQMGQHVQQGLRQMKAFVYCLCSETQYLCRPTELSDSNGLNSRNKKSRQKLLVNLNIQQAARSTLGSRVHSNYDRKRSLFPELMVAHSINKPLPLEAMQCSPKI